MDCDTLAQLPLSPGLAALLALLLVPLSAAAQSDAGTASTLPQVVITATRVETSPFDVPASIDRIGDDEIRDGRARINISESLGGVPGLLARDRQNYAQDVQISVRGFGARASFGIRGVRLYVDGIPATFPDGQGQISNVDLGSAASIEVLRGPFSALYGNSSGGVIQVFTQEGAGPRKLELSAAGGSDRVMRAAATVSGADGPIGYLISASHFQTDGYREHSAAERYIGNAKLSWHPDDSSKLTLVLNSVALPRAQDPLGLTRAQFEADPRSVDPSATQFNTRKSIDQTQGGLIYERRLDGVNSLRAMVYTGTRNTEQFQAIPVATQANPLNPGGVIALGSDYSGTDLRWTARTSLAGRAFTLVAGLAYDRLGQLRRGYQNFIGKSLGVAGALRRDEDDGVSNLDQYLQASWQPAPAWTLNAGLRHSRVRFESQDHYIVGPNGDDSGAVQYGANLPAFGVLYAFNSGLHAYATAGRGFETPTFNELAYRPSGAPGLNFALQPARSLSTEIGLKARWAEAGEATAAVFETHTDNEIVSQTNQGGRSTYQNVGATKRSGIELSWANRFFGNLRAHAAYTLLDAQYRDGFTTCATTPCAVPNQLIPAGNRIPGIARSSFFASLGWTPVLGWRAGIEGRYLSRVYVNDANTDAAPSYAVASASLGYVSDLGLWHLHGFVRGDNLFARRYAGSVIVNESNGRYFEPAPGRTWLAGLSGTLSF
ncbi:MAG TPA: TonB-dependent receptor [Methylibium sp.]